MGIVSLTGQKDQVVFFPLAGRLDLVRRSASELDALNGEAANMFWRARCRELAAEIMALGCDEDEMREQILAFQDAVQIELWSRHQQSADAIA